MRLLLALVVAAVAVTAPAQAATAVRASSSTALSWPAAWVPPPAPKATTVAAPPRPATTTAPAPSLAQDLAQLHLMNYYPATHAWTAMWERWDPAGFATDMARIRGLGGNAVRLVVFPDVTGFPAPTPAAVARLQDAVRLAAANGLRVQLTLFDWWGDFPAVAASKTWATAILRPFANDQRIASVELKNEVDPADAAQMAWARELLPVVKQVSGRPVTISTLGGSRAVSDLGALITALGPVQPDFYSFHVYADPARAGTTYGALAQAKALAGGRPLFVGETGTTSGQDGRTSAEGEFQQDLFFRTVDAATRALGLPAPAPWTFSDFTTAAMPARGGAAPAERSMGLLRLDGTPKPVAGSVAAAWAGRPTSTAFNAGFESGSAASGPLGWRRWRPSDATFSRDTAVRRSGVASGRIDAAGGDASGFPSFYVAPPVPIQPGRRYAAAAWARGRAVTGPVDVAVAWFDDAGTYLGSSASPGLPGGSSVWTRLAVTAAAPARAAYAELHLQAARSAGTAWFDDVTFDVVP